MCVVYKANNVWLLIVVCLCSYIYVYKRSCYAILFYYAVGTITFEHSAYSANENDADPIKPVLILSHALSMDITVQVIDNSNTAMGK